METRFEPLESIGGGVFVTPEHGFGADALLLADFATCRGKAVCELGTGCGVIALLLARDNAVTAVEIQPEAAALATRSAAACGLPVRVFTADWRALDGLLPAGLFDRVVCNPPYFPAGGGRENDSPARRIARHEESPAALGELCAAAARLLKNGGTFCLCHRPERLCDLTDALRKNGLEPKRIEAVCHPGGQQPWLILCEAKRGGRPGVKVTVTTA